MKRWFCTAILAIAMFATPSSARAEFDLKDNDVVVFYGDTAFGEFHFTKWFDLFLRIKYPDLKARTINVGRNANVITRALEQLDKEVLVFKPTRVVLCFGLEDGGRRAFEQSAADAFIKKMTELIDRVQGAGAKVMLVTPPTPEDHKNAATAKIKYSEVMRQYSDAIKKLGEDKKLEVIDWNAMTADYQAKFPPTDKRHMTRDGLMPVAPTIAVLMDALLEYWRAEPFTQQITAHKSGSDKVEVTHGSGSFFNRAGERMMITLTDVPIPLEMPDTNLIPTDEWPLARWSSYKLTVPDAPESGGAMLACAGKTVPPIKSASLREGVDLGALGVFNNFEPVSDLNIRAITKANQYIQYRESLHRPVPEPELVEGFRLYSQADLSLADGAYKIFLRTSSRMTARLEITFMTDTETKAAQEQARDNKARPGKLPKIQRKRGG